MADWRLQALQRSRPVIFRVRTTGMFHSSPNEHGSTCYDEGASKGQQSAMPARQEPSSEPEDAATKCDPTGRTDWLGGPDPEL